MTDVPLMYRAISSSLEAELTDAGVEEAAEIARRICVKFCEAHSGNIYRVPTLKSMLNVDRDKAVKGDSEAMTVPELMRKYGLSSRQIYNILGKSDE